MSATNSKELNLKMNPKLVSFEVGHTTQAEGKFRVCITGADGYDIGDVVKKVVFHILRNNHSDCLEYEQWTSTKSPFEFTGTSLESMKIPIQVHMKNKKYTKIKFRYRIRKSNDKGIIRTKIFTYEFCNAPNEVNNGNRKRSKPKLVSISKNKKFDGFAEDHNSKRAETKINNTTENITEVSKPKPTDENFTMPSTIQDEPTIQMQKITEMAYPDKNVSLLRVALENYRKSKQAIILPPLSDPIYDMPELPQSLKLSLKSREQLQMNNTKIGNIIKMLEHNETNKKDMENFKLMLKEAGMTESEIETVKGMCLCIDKYNKSENAIILPPMSDPIYDMPKLPESLKFGLIGRDIDVALHSNALN